MRKILFALSVTALLMGCDEHNQKKAEEAINSAQQSAQQAIAEKNSSDTSNKDLTDCKDNKTAVTPAQSAQALTPSQSATKPESSTLPVIIEETVTEDALADSPAKTQAHDTTPRIAPKDKVAAPNTDPAEDYTGVIIVEK